MSQLTPNGNSRPSTAGYTTYKGGACWQFASLYESTNPAIPGTGLVNFVVCDAPTSTSINVKYPTTEPSATPIPIYPAPSPSNSPS